MAHPCQALSSGTIQWQQGHLRALSPGHSPSWHCHQPRRLRAGGGQQAPAPHPLSWPGSLHLSCPVLKDTASGDSAPLPPAQSSPSCSRPKACRSCLLAPTPGIESWAFLHRLLFSPRGTSSLLEIGSLGSWPPAGSPALPISASCPACPPQVEPRATSHAVGSPSRGQRGTLNPRPPPPTVTGAASPLPHRRDSFFMVMPCLSGVEGPSQSPPCTTSSLTPGSPLNVTSTLECFFGSLHSQSLGGSM